MIKIAFCLALLAPPARAADVPHLDKVVVIVLENTDFVEAIKKPFMASLAKQGALLTDYHAITHPSQPNYIAMVAGTTAGVTDDSNVTRDIRHLGDLLEEKKLGWKVYAEGYPGNCFLGPPPWAGKYARKHVPFLSFKDVQDDKEGRCANVVGGPAFFKDLADNALPAFSLYVPDLDDDGHDTGARYADDWLAKEIGPLLDSWPRGVLLVVTFDEDSTRYPQRKNRIYTALYGSMVAPGSTSGDHYDHYSLLRTVEAGLGLGTLHAADDSAAAIGGVWK